MVCVVAGREVEGCKWVLRVVVLRWWCVVAGRLKVVSGYLKL